MLAAAASASRRRELWSCGAGEVRGRRAVSLTSSIADLACAAASLAGGLSTAGGLTGLAAGGGGATFAALAGAFAGAFLAGAFGSAALAGAFLTALAGAFLAAAFAG